MSVRALDWAFSQDLPPSEKLVLLSLADHYNGQTGVCIPGQKSLAEQTSMCVRTVQRHLKSLEERGLIVRTARFRGEGRGRTSDSYELRMKGDNVSPYSDQGDKSDTTKATNQDDQGDSGVVTGTGREPEGNRKSPRKTAIPDGWQPDQALADELTKRYPNLNISQQAEAFVDWHGSKGNKFIHHGKAFRNWCRIADERRQKMPNRQPPGIGTGGVPW
ncbi:MAG TPA: helix-turn-helix domain-containing protein [Acidimicrobiia bacterium]